MFNVTLFLIFLLFSKTKPVVEEIEKTEDEKQKDLDKMIAELKEEELHELKKFVY